MSDLVPAQAPPAAPSLLAPLTDTFGGPVLTRLGRFARQEPVKRMVPWFLGVAALGGAALAWTEIAPSPQRTLYSQLDDGERANVVAALDKAAVPYRLDAQTGALTVAENDYYRARMLVASDNALASPASGSDMLDSLPIGASRSLEGERLREAREHELMLTIKQIDGVESVRVHLAEPERSVFVRDDVPPSASVMLRLARGRHLGEGQVLAIVNLVAGSVPGLSPDAVRVVDQSGKLLSGPGNAAGRAEVDRLELQSRMEEKLRAQLGQLLTPMLGDGNFSSEIQIDLDMDQVTTARESYDKQGALRSEQAQQSQAPAPGQAGGVPGVLSNTPPPPTVAKPGAPQGTPSPTASAEPLSSDSSSSRTYELGREVAVANAAPGKVKRLSVAVAISAAALRSSKPADLAQLKQLVGAAVGADAARGDQVEVVVRRFEPLASDAPLFYEAPWFATVVRIVGAVLAVLLVLLLGVRPLINAFRPPGGAAAPGEGGGIVGTLSVPMLDSLKGKPDSDMLTRNVGAAQRLVAEKPDSAVAALRQMLADQPEAQS